MLPRRVWVVIIIVLLLAALLSVALLEVTGKTFYAKTPTPSTASQDQNPLLPSIATPTSFHPELKMIPATPDVSPNGSHSPTNDHSPRLKDSTPSLPEPDEPGEIPIFSSPTGRSQPDGRPPILTEPQPTVRQSTKNDVSSPLKEFTPPPPRPGKPREIPNFPIPTSQGGGN